MPGGGPRRRRRTPSPSSGGAAGIRRINKSQRSTAERGGSPYGQQATSKPSQYRQPVVSSGESSWGGKKGRSLSTPLETAKPSHVLPSSVSAVAGESRKGPFTPLTLGTVPGSPAVRPGPKESAPSTQEKLKQLRQIKQTRLQGDIHQTEREIRSRGVKFKLPKLPKPGTPGATKPLKTLKGRVQNFQGRLERQINRQAELGKIDHPGKLASEQGRGNYGKRIAEKVVGDALPDTPGEIALFAAGAARGPTAIVGAARGVKEARDVSKAAGVVRNLEKAGASVADVNKAKLAVKFPRVAGGAPGAGKGLEAGAAKAVTTGGRAIGAYRHGKTIKRIRQGATVASLPFTAPAAAGAAKATWEDPGQVAKTTLRGLGSIPAAGIGAAANLGLTGHRLLELTKGKDLGEKGQHGLDWALHPTATWSKAMLDEAKKEIGVFTSGDVGRISEATKKDYGLLPEIGALGVARFGGGDLLRGANAKLRHLPRDEHGNAPPVFTRLEDRPGNMLRREKGREKSQKQYREHELGGPVAKQSRRLASTQKEGGKAAAIANSLRKGPENKKLAALSDERGWTGDEKINTGSLANAAAENPLMRFKNSAEARDYVALMKDHTPEDTADGRMLAAIERTPEIYDNPQFHKTVEAINKTQREIATSETVTHYPVYEEHVKRREAENLQRAKRGLGPKPVREYPARPQEQVPLETLKYTDEKTKKGAKEEVLRERKELKTIRGSHPDYKLAEDQVKIAESGVKAAKQKLRTARRNRGDAKAAVYTPGGENLRGGGVPSHYRTFLEEKIRAAKDPEKRAKLEARLEDLAAVEPEWKVDRSALKGVSVSMGVKKPVVVYVKPLPKDAPLGAEGSHEYVGGAGHRITLRPNLSPEDASINLYHELAHAAEAERGSKGVPFNRATYEADPEEALVREAEVRHEVTPLVRESRVALPKGRRDVARAHLTLREAEVRLERAKAERQAVHERAPKSERELHLEARIEGKRRTIGPVSLTPEERTAHLQDAERDLGRPLTKREEAVTLRVAQRKKRDDIRAGQQAQIDQKFIHDSRAVMGDYGHAGEEPGYFPHARSEDISPSAPGHERIAVTKDKERELGPGSLQHRGGVDYGMHRLFNAIGATASKESTARYSKFVADTMPLEHDLGDGKQKIFSKKQQDAMARSGVYKPADYYRVPQTFLDNPEILSPDFWKTLEGVDEGEGMGRKDARQQQLDAELQKQGREGQGVGDYLIKRKVFDRYLRGQKDLSDTARALQKIGTIQSRAILATSFAWMTSQIVAEGGLLMATQNPIRLATAVKNLARIRKDPELARVLAGISDTSYGTDPFHGAKGISDYHDGVTKANKVATQTPFVPYVKSLAKFEQPGNWDRFKGAYLRDLYTLSEMDKQFNSHMRDFARGQSGTWNAIDEISREMRGKTPEEQLRYLNSDAGRAAAREFEISVDRALGNWTAMSPWERNISQVVIFYPFMRFSVDWALRTFPADHPVRYTIATSMGQWNAEQLEKWLTDRPSFATDWFKAPVYGGEGDRPSSFTGFSRFTPGSNAWFESIGSGKSLYGSLLGMSNPLVSGILRGVTGYNEFGEYDPTQKVGDIVGKSLVGLTAPTRGLRQAGLLEKGAGALGLNWDVFKPSDTPGTDRGHTNVLGVNIPNYALRSNVVPSLPTSYKDEKTKATMGELWQDVQRGGKQAGADYTTMETKKYGDWKNEDVGNLADVYKNRGMDATKAREKAMPTTGHEAMRLLKFGTKKSNPHYEDYKRYLLEGVSHHGGTEISDRAKRRLISLYGDTGREMPTSLQKFYAEELDKNRAGEKSRKGPRLQTEYGPSKAKQILAPGRPYVGDVLNERRASETGGRPYGQIPGKRTNAERGAFPYGQRAGAELGDQARAQDAVRAWRKAEKGALPYGQQAASGLQENISRATEEVAKATPGKNVIPAAKRLAGVKAGVKPVPIGQAAADGAKNIKKAGADIPGPAGVYVNTIARRTGLSAAVVAAWTTLEGGNQSGDWNRLNIGHTNSGPNSAAMAPGWNDPKSAAKNTVAFLKGKKFGAGNDIPNIIRNARGKSDEEQIDIIANSGWAVPGGAEYAAKIKSVYNSQGLSGGGATSVKFSGPASPQLRQGFKQAVRLADKLDKAGIPYDWGGGHVTGKIPGPKQGGTYDCSGAVSWLLQRMGVKLPGALVSGDLATTNYLKPGEGAVTVFANGEHTFMKIGDRYWGTSGSYRDQSGPGWFQGTPSKSYLSGFTARHVPGYGTKQAKQLGAHLVGGMNSGGAGISIGGGGGGGTTSATSGGGGATGQKAGGSFGQAGGGVGTSSFKVDKLSAALTVPGAASTVAKTRSILQSLPEIPKGKPYKKRPRLRIGT